MTEILTAVANVATALGVFLAVWQLYQAHRQNVTSFEDSFAREYRELAATLPTKALLGEELTEDEHKEHLDEFYHYFDLCNEQAFLHQCERISDRTWEFWHDGIASNLKRPAFSRAWSEVCKRAKSDFSELRTLFPPRETDFVDRNAEDDVLQRGRVHASVVALHLGGGDKEVVSVEQQPRRADAVRAAS
jgi:hypothetical protein